VRRAGTFAGLLTCRTPHPSLPPSAAAGARSAFYQSETANGGRFAYDANVSAFDNLDSYMPPYAAGFVAGGAAGAMCSYSSFNGVPSCASPWLLTDMVRGYWGRPDAVIMSDCGAVEDQYTAKHWAANISDASARTVQAGCGEAIGRGGGGGRVEYHVQSRRKVRRSRDRPRDCERAAVACRQFPVRVRRGHAAPTDRSSRVCEGVAAMSTASAPVRTHHVWVLLTLYYRYTKRQRGLHTDGSLHWLPLEHPAAAATYPSSR
jgi:hypothetical protein